MKIIFFLVFVSLFLQTIASQCPFFKWAFSCDYDDDEVDFMCRNDDDCRGDQICCTIGCLRVCVDPEKPPMTTEEPYITTEEPPITTKKPPVTIVPGAKMCFSQSDCGRSQCCTNANPNAEIGICQNRKRVSQSCHNPRSTGFHHVWCPGPPGIVHPFLCPCGCGEFCAMGPNPSRDGLGGYIGTCSFG